MTQDNIFYSAGSVREAVLRTKAVAGFSLKIEGTFGALSAKPVC
jgi:hypothetical protein